LYDWPINPINVPSFIIFKRPTMKPEEVVEKIMAHAGTNRCSVKMVKILGKYYFK